MRHIPHQSHLHRRARHYGSGLCHGGRQPLPCSRRALSLIEIIVVIAVIGILVGLLYTGYRGVMGVVDKTRCATNLRQIGQHILLYAADNDGVLVQTLQRGEDTTSGPVWIQIMHQAGIFEVGPPAGPRTFPSWHLNPAGMFTCPSMKTREEGRIANMRKRHLSEQESTYSAYWYDGIHYGMLGTIAGSNARRSHGWEPLKIYRFPNPATTMIVGETDFRYLMYPNSTQFRAMPHNGSFYLNLDGSVAFWEGPLPQFSTGDTYAPPFWTERYR